MLAAVFIDDEGSVQSLHQPDELDVIHFAANEHEPTEAELRSLLPATGHLSVHGTKITRRLPLLLQKLLQLVNHSEFMFKQLVMVC